MATPSEKTLSVVERIQQAKQKANKSYSQIATETGLTNVYVAQLLRRQAHLKPDTAQKLRAALPELTDDLIEQMMKPPFRSFDPDVVQEPAIYRLHEASMHFGESIKEIINEEFGDGMEINGESSSKGWSLNSASLACKVGVGINCSTPLPHCSMSAIDFYCSVDKVKGADGKDRVVITFDGKYLPYSEQKSEHMLSRPTR